MNVSLQCLYTCFHRCNEGTHGVLRIASAKSTVCDSQRALPLRLIIAIRNDVRWQRLPSIEDNTVQVKTTQGISMKESIKGICIEDKSQKRSICVCFHQRLTLLTHLKDFEVSSVQLVNLV